VKRSAVSGWLAVAALALCVAGSVVWLASRDRSAHGSGAIVYQPRKVMDVNGSDVVMKNLTPWPADASLEEIARHWDRVGYQKLEAIDQYLAQHQPTDRKRLDLLITAAAYYNYEGDPEKAYERLEQARQLVEEHPTLAREWLYTIIYFQGVTGLRIGENDNCVLCRGESACILPIALSAIHTKPRGSQLAIQHFREYLDHFPDDLEVRWLLNLAHMTLGTYPDQVDPHFRIDLSRYQQSELNIGKFLDVADQAGVNRLNQAGGAIMEDFDNDGLLDIVTTSMSPTASMAYFHNKGDGTFEDWTEKAGLTKQLGGLYCVQGDYNNDGHMDIFIPRGAWLSLPIRPSLLKNNGDGTFTDVTRQAGLLDPVNSITACWGDYDNDGFLDLFVACERQPNRLYHNRGDGTFEEVAVRAGVQGNGDTCKGATWIDYDNDGYPDLFCSGLKYGPRLYHNNHDGTFTDVTQSMGIDGPLFGFSCWAWDYDNDGWPDIFASCYSHSLEDVVRGLLGQPYHGPTCKLYHNLHGQRFVDVTKDAGLDKVYAAMGSNFADFDNDGYLDFYLGTGDPELGTLIPNRMFKNVGGKRFADITGTSGTGHLQKGHAVACGDLSRDGNIDIFIEMGGFTNGDRFHNLLFRNPGHKNHWLTVKLVGKKTNRAAIGARIKVVTAGPKPLRVYRYVSSGSSFGANPLQQTIGLAKSERVARLEIFWPTSGTTQVFENVAADQAIEVTEFANAYRRLNWKPIPRLK